MKNVFRLALPSQLAHQLCAAVDAGRVPKATQLSHARVIFGVAFMKWMQGHNAELVPAPEMYRIVPSLKEHTRASLGLTSCVRTALLDSSPMGGRNWLVHEYFTYSAEDAVRAYDAQVELILIHLNGDDIEAIDVDDDIFDDGDDDEFGGADFHSVQEGRTQSAASKRSSLSDVIIRTCDHHIGPLTAHGCREAKLVQKIHNVLYATYLETGSWPGVLAHARSVISWTSDLGTESGIGKAPAVDLQSMFPYLQTLAEPAGGAEHNRDPTCDPRVFERAFVVPGV